MFSQKKPTKVSTIQRGPVQAQARGIQQRSPVPSPPNARPTATTPKPPQWPKPIQAKMTRVGGVTPKAAGVSGRAVQLSRKAVREAVPIGEEGKITVKGKQYKGWLFVNARPVYFDFTSKPWPIDLDFKGTKYFDYESDKGKKRTLVRWENEGINAEHVFINRNPGIFLRLIVTLE